MSGPQDDCPAPVIKTGFLVSFLATSSDASTTAAAPSEKGQQSCKVRGVQTTKLPRTFSTVMSAFLPKNCALGLMLPCRYDCMVTFAICSRSFWRGIL